jgi:hypothetical protein
MMEKVRKPSNSLCYTPSSEPIRIYKYMCSQLEKLKIFAQELVTSDMFRHGKSLTCVENKSNKTLQEWTKFSVDTLRASGMRKKSIPY